MVLERSLTLLQQEEEEFRAKEGIHKGKTQRKQKTLGKHRKQKLRVHAAVTVRSGLLSQ